MSGAGAHAYQEKLQELGLSSLEKIRGKGDPGVSATVVWDGEEKQSQPPLGGAQQ